MKALILVGVVVGLSACGGDRKSLSYDFSENGCQTKHSLNTQQEYCDTLKDRSKNMQEGVECARRARYDEFQRQCSGQKWDN